MTDEASVRVPLTGEMVQVTFGMSFGITGDIIPGIVLASARKSGIPVADLWMVTDKGGHLQVGVPHFTLRSTGHNPAKDGALNLSGTWRYVPDAD